MVDTLIRLKINNPTYVNRNIGDIDPKPGNLDFLLPLDLLTSLSIRGFSIYDEHLSILSKLPLTALDISNCKNITGEGLKYICYNLTQLTMLSLSKCKINSGIIYLDNLHFIQEINFYGCSLGYKDVTYIKSLFHLEDTKHPCSTKGIEYLRTF